MATINPQKNRTAKQSTVYGGSAYTRSNTRSYGQKYLGQGDVGLRDVLGLSPLKDEISKVHEKYEKSNEKKRFDPLSRQYVPIGDFGRQIHESRRDKALEALEDKITPEDVVRKQIEYNKEIEEAVNKRNDYEQKGLEARKKYEERTAKARGDSEDTLQRTLDLIKEREKEDADFTDLIQRARDFGEWGVERLGKMETLLADMWEKVNGDFDSRVAQAGQAIGLRAFDAHEEFKRKIGMSPDLTEAQKKSAVSQHQLQTSMAIGGAVSTLEVEQAKLELQANSDMAKITEIGTRYGVLSALQTQDSALKLEFEATKLEQAQDDSYLNWKIMAENNAATRQLQILNAELNGDAGLADYLHNMNIYLPPNGADLLIFAEQMRRTFADKRTNFGGGGSSSSAESKELLKYPETRYISPVNTNQQRIPTAKKVNTPFYAPPPPPAPNSDPTLPTSSYNDPNV